MGLPLAAGERERERERRDDAAKQEQSKAAKRGLVDWYKDVKRGQERPPKDHRESRKGQR